MLRLAEILVDKEADTHRVVKIKDVKYTETNIELTLRTSKHNRVGRPHYMLMEQKSFPQNISPVKWIRKCSSRKKERNLETPLFNLGGRPIKRSTYKRCRRQHHISKYNGNEAEPKAREAEAL